VKKTRLEATLWGAAAAAALLAALGWRGAVTSASAARPASEQRPLALPRYAAPDSLRAAAGAVVAHDPFRLERRPASVAYGPETENAANAPPPPPRPPRPALAVGGIVGGPGHWAALLEGVPGRDGGVLVRRGDRLGDLLVRAVGRDTVVVSAPDTTWRLAVRGTFK
jgi:hypothetical protein